MIAVPAPSECTDLTPLPAAVRQLLTTYEQAGQAASPLLPELLLQAGRHRSLALLNALAPHIAPTPEIAQGLRRGAEALLPQRQSPERQAVMDRFMVLGRPLWQEEDYRKLLASALGHGAWNLPIQIQILRAFTTPALVAPVVGDLSRASQACQA